MAPLTGSFVELGDEGCVVWSRTGKKLNSIQSGYAHTALIHQTDGIARCQIDRAGNLFYLLADNAVECFDASGTQQWSQNLDTSPQALLANSKDLLLFSGNTVQKLEAPAE